jgi:hypothetical protein
MSEIFQRRQGLHGKIEDFASGFPDPQDEPWSKDVISESAATVEQLRKSYEQEYGVDKPTVHSTVLGFLQAAVKLSGSDDWRSGLAVNLVGKAKQYSLAAKERGKVPVPIEYSDVAGHLHCGITPYAKQNGVHAPFSVKSSQSKHVGLMGVLFEKSCEKEGSKAALCLKGENGLYHPVVFLRSDNGLDQQMDKIQCQLPLWDLFEWLKADYLLKAGYCPGRSKENSVEIGNRVVKGCWKGYTIGSGDGSEGVMDKAGRTGESLIQGKTYSREEITVGFVKRRELQVANDMDILDELVALRRKAVRDGLH